MKRILDTVWYLILATVALALDSQLSVDSLRALTQPSTQDAIAKDGTATCIRLGAVLGDQSPGQSTKGHGNSTKTVTL